MPPASLRSERPSLVVVEDSVEAARSIAREIAALVRARQAAGSFAVLGLATGRSPLGVYAELARMHREDELSFAQAYAFNLDEYVGLAPGDARSFRAFMERELLARVDFAPDRARVPRGDAADVEQECARYRAEIAAAGGIDLQLLGLGRNGHIAFNEPGSPRDSRMRRVELDEVTRADAAREFGGIERVPRAALTLGVADILEARAIRVLAFGEKKRACVERVLSGPAGVDVPATFLCGHPDVVLYADRAAAGQSR